MATVVSHTFRDWRDATFGDVRDLRALVRRAREELDELEQAIAAGDLGEAGLEAADVVIVLHRLAALAGHDLAEQVDVKMAINRARSWKSAGDGTGEHA
jgi:NTP pyrophosphatase (non-canonical NTP hydrolase)